MKVGLLLIAVALVLGGLVGMLVFRDPGYVLIAYDTFAVETSLWVAVVLLLLIYLTIRLVTFAWSRLGRGGGRIAAWHASRQSRGAENQTLRGAVLLAEGQWSDAKKLLVGAATRVSNPFINYLQAAQAAHKLGDVLERDRLLGEARESAPRAKFAVGLTEARLHESAGLWQQCLAVSLELFRQAPRHPEVLALLAQSYENLGDWQALLEILPALKKHKALPETELADFYRRAWLARLSERGSDARALVSELGKAQKQDPEVAIAFARALKTEAPAEALDLLRRAIAADWHEALVLEYGCIQSPQPKRQLSRAESWQKNHPNDPALLLTLSRISRMNQAWAKAKDYLEASLNQRPGLAVYAELGNLVTAMGEVENGAVYLRQALQHSLVGLPDLPLPEEPSDAKSAEGS